MENKKYSEPYEFDKAIDSESIANLYDNDYTWIEEVFSSVLAEYGPGTAQIEQTLAEKDVEGLRKAVHKMKPVFGFVGMLQMQEMCKNLEDNCHGETSISVIENETTILLNNLATCREILEKRVRPVEDFQSKIAMNLNCIIVEDLTVAADYLQKCCEKDGHVQVLARFTNVKDAVSFLNDNWVDLIFLDVEMPEEFGYDLLDQIGYSPKVIITTSKTEYAYHGFEYNVTDFLKKPFTYHRFAEAIKKVITAIESTNKEKGQDHIYIKTEGKLIRLLNTDILYIESMGDYVKFVTPAKKYVTLNTIKNLEEKVNKQVFMKVHRSFIINMSKVENIRENALFIQGTEIPISKANKSDVMKRINVI